MATVEIAITIRLDPTGTPAQGGISEDAEDVVDDIFFLTCPTVDGALRVAEGALRDAIDACHNKAVLSR